MPELTPGTTAPAFVLPGSDGKQVSLQSFRGKKVVLYFYPEDGSGLCLQQACDLRDHQRVISEQGAVIIGISPDPVATHQTFIRDQSLNFLLLSDEEHRVMKLYGVWASKVMFGRRYMGILRTTYLIDEHGKITHTFKRVRIKSHIPRIMKALSE